MAGRRSCAAFLDSLDLVPHFQLVTVDGDALGVVEFGQPDWPIGSVIHQAPSIPNLRVVDRISVAGDPEEFDSSSSRTYRQRER